MRKHLAITAAAGAAASISGAIGVASAGDDDRSASGAGAYQQTNLVSSIPGLAPTTDPNLKNPWGIAWAPGGALWVSANATHVSTLYNGDGTIVPLVVSIPGANAAPTGIVWNPNPNQFLFHVDNGPEGGAVFIFVGEDGKITAWNPTVSGRTTAAVVHDSGSAAVYKGLAFGTNAGGNFIFATNFSEGKVEAYDSKFNETKLKGSFSDPKLPKGYGPFGIANIEGDLFVTFAKQDSAKHDDVSGPGLGLVDVFNTDGQLIRRFTTGGPLNAPWGLVRAPLGFGKFGGAILVGNFGTTGQKGGSINAFGNRGEFLGELRSTNGRPILIDGMWGLGFGTFAKADPDNLYFTAGIKDESEGLLGEIKPVAGKY